MHQVVFREIHLEEFVHDFHFAFLVGEETISHTIIESTEFHRILATEFQEQLVIMITDVRELEWYDRLEVFVHHPGGTLHDSRFFAQHLLAYLHLHGTVFHQGFVSVSDVIRNLV